MKKKSRKDTIFEIARFELFFFTTKFKMRNYFELIFELQKLKSLS